MSKLGFHVVRGARAGYNQALARCAQAKKPLRVVKVVDAFDAAAQAKKTSRKTITVGRVSSVRVVNRMIDLQTPVNLNMRPTEYARRYYSLVKPTWHAHRKSIDYWESFNAYSDDWDWQSEFFVALMDLAEADKFKLALFACASGQPEIAANVVHMLPACQRAKAHGGHILTLHETGAHTLREAQPFHALHYRWLYKSFLIPYNADIPLIISEAAPGNGTHYIGLSAFVHDLAWYDSELQKDSYVLGAAAFTLGDWVGANFQRALPALSAYLTDAKLPPKRRPSYARSSPVPKRPPPPRPKRAARQPTRSRPMPRDPVGLARYTVSKSSDVEALPQVASSSAVRRVRVKVDWLRMRDGAARRDTHVLAELPRGTELTVLEERAGWLRVARPTGWVSEDYVKDVGQG